MRNLVLIAMVIGGLALGSAHAADVVVKIAPPSAVVERRGASSTPRHVWIAGYYRWNGKAYVWIPGRWVLPPRAGAVWVAPRWRHRLEGYVFSEGRWR